MQRMTIGQLDRALQRENTIYLQSTYDPIGDQLVELTDTIRGFGGVQELGVAKLIILENGSGVIARIDLPANAITEFEEV